MIAKNCDQYLWTSREAVRPSEFDPRVFGVAGRCNPQFGPEYVPRKNILKMDKIKYETMSRRWWLGIYH